MRTSPGVPTVLITAEDKDEIRDKINAVDEIFGAAHIGQRLRRSSLGYVVERASANRPQLASLTKQQGGGKK